MNRGTKSLLIGVHQVAVHPFVVAEAWRRLYGFPWDPRLWVAFVVHDLGYWGCPDMDGEVGEQHPYLGAKIMRAFFGEEWGDFALLHSRYLAAKLGRPPSRLCMADKLAIVIEPSWLYLPRAWASGELGEFMAMAQTQGVKSPNITEDERTGYASENPWRWHRALKSYMARWIKAHRELSSDGWTKPRGTSEGKGNP